MLIVALLTGFVLGVLTGLLPGLHPNNIIPIVLSLSFLFNPLELSIILISTGVINSFINAIPSIIFGAPDDSNALSILPGHKLLLKGRGLEAVKVSVNGSLGGIVFALLILPFFILFFSRIYLFLRNYLHYILIFVSIHMMFTERGFKKLFAITCFFLAGFLGVIVLDFSSKYILPLLTGMFALPSLIVSTKTRKMEIEEEEPKLEFDIKSIIIGGLGGILAGLLPGLGSAQITALTQQIFRKSDERSFLSSIGSVTSSDFVYSILALWIIGNPRSGVAVAVGNILEINLTYVLVFLVIIFLSAVFGYFLTLTISKKLIPKLLKINYSSLSLIIISFIIALILIFTNLLGFLIALISALIGFLTIKTGIKRSVGMSCLILPTIIFFATS